MRLKKHIAMLLMVPVCLGCSGLFVNGLGEEQERSSGESEKILPGCFSPGSLVEHFVEEQIICTNGEWEDYAAESFSAGDGLSEDTAFEIESAEQLALLSRKVNFEEYRGYFHYKLTKDIDLKEHFWDAIGTSERGFCGSFNGNGHKIHNLRINKKSRGYQGLFGRADQRSVVKNLNIVDCLIFADFYVGGFIGCADGVKLESCSITGATLDAEYNLVGSLIGSVTPRCSLINCNVDRSVVYGEFLVGELCGNINNVFMSNCKSTNSVVINRQEDFC